MSSSHINGNGATHPMPILSSLRCVVSVINARSLTVQADGFSNA